MLEWVRLFVQLLPLVLAIIREIQRARLTVEAQQEVIADLEASTELLTARATAARAQVDQSEDAIDRDPFNSD